MRMLVAAVVGGLALSSLTGCIAIAGGNDTASPTLGRQLIDLKAALDSGAISEAEYQSARSQLVGNATRSD